MSQNNCPPNCTCFCPSANTPVPLVVQEGGPAGQIDIPIYGTAPFQASILTNPMLPSGNPVVQSIAMYGNILRVNFSAAADPDAIAAYTATIQICNACGSVDVQVTLQVVDFIPPPQLDCALMQGLFPDALRPADPTDLLFATDAMGACVRVSPPVVPPPVIECGQIAALFTPLGRPFQAGDLLFGQAMGQCVALQPRDFCTDMQALVPTVPFDPATAFVPWFGPDQFQTPGCYAISLANIVALVPTVDVCEELQNFEEVPPAGYFTIFGHQFDEVNDRCVQFTVDELCAACGGNFPLLAPDGDCTAPSYSFAASNTSGMFFNPAIGPVGAVVIGVDQCTDFIEIGASVTLNASTSFIILRGGYDAPGSACGIIVETNNIERLRIGSNGAWNLNTLGGGNPGDVITSAGPGAPPSWQPASLSFPVLAPDGSCAAPSYSFASSTDSGMWFDPALGLSGAVVISDHNCTNQINVGASITLRTGDTSNININAGDGSNVNITTATGIGFSPGTISISAGNTPLFGQQGGLVAIDGGASSGGGGIGGSISIGGGSGSSSSNGGQLQFSGGSTDTGIGGAAGISGGAATGVGGSAGPVQISGGTATAAGGVAGNVDLYGGRHTAGANQGNVRVLTGAAQTERLRISGVGEWFVGGSAGVAAQVLTSNGPGVAPTWQAAGGAPFNGGAIANPITAANGSCAAPSYSFTNDSDSGLWWDSTDGGKITLSNDNCRDKIVLGSTNAANATAIFMQAGFGAAGTTGGGFHLLGGDCHDGNPGGHIRLEGGRHAVSSGNGGSIFLTGGLSTVGGGGGDIVIQTGSSPARGGRFSVSMGSGDSSINSLNQEAGFVWPGAPASNNFGNFGLYTGGINAGGRIFSMNNSGDITFHGTIGGQGTKHFYNNRDITLGRSDLIATATGGFPFIPRLAAPPTGVPTNYGGCSPLVIQETGAGALTLWSYNYADALWHSVTLP